VTQSFTAKDAGAAKEENSFTAKNAKAAKESIIKTKPKGREGTAFVLIIFPFAVKLFSLRPWRPSR
jgi:hypothetical protein